MLLPPTIPPTFYYIQCRWNQFVEQQQQKKSFHQRTHFSCFFSGVSMESKVMCCHGHTMCRMSFEFVQIIDIQKIHTWVHILDAIHWFGAVEFTRFRQKRGHKSQLGWNENKLRRANVTLGVTARQFYWILVLVYRS